MTKLFTIYSVFVIAGVDVFFVISGNETISEFLYGMSKRYPIIAAAFGIILGHLFWPIREKNNE